MELTEQQVDYIFRDICTKGIESEELARDLLDHICCVMETEAEEVKSFDLLYPTVLARFFDKELSEIQKETNLLIRFSNYYAMKRVMLNSGTFSAILFIIGAIFKSMHWPGAGMMLVLAIFSFCFIFLPLLFLFKVKEPEKQNNKITLGLGVLFGMLLSLGVVFKIMHWPGANIMAYSSLAILFFLYLPFHFFMGRRNPETRSNNAISSILILAACGLLFTLTNLRPSVRYSQSIIRSHIDQENTLYQLHQQFNERVIKSPMTEEQRAVYVLAQNALSDIEKVRSLLLNDRKVNGVKPTESEAIISDGNNFDIPTNLLFNNKGEPMELLSAMMKNIQLFKAGLNKDHADMIHLEDRSLDGTDENMVTWENAAFFKIPLEVVFRNLNQLEIDVLIAALAEMK